MIKVHHLNSSRSHRILWMLEELELPYEIVAYQRDPVTRLAPPSLKAIHPLGKSPVITDGDRVVAESGAIIEYLAKGPGGGRLWPRDGSANWVEHAHWMHFAEGSAMLPLMLALYTSRLGAAAAPLQPRIESEIANHLGYMEGALADRPYFAGQDFTAADIQLSFILEGADASDRLASYSRLRDILARYRARPAYARAIAKGGALALTRR
jgi:glutathione S-transferase